jgi:hypothetical protein
MPRGIFTTLHDRRRRPIARFGFDIENWPEFLTETAAGIAVMQGGVKH